MKNILPPLTLVLVLALAAFVVYDKMTRITPQAETKIEYVKAPGDDYLNISIPEKFDFCGEAVPLNDPDVWERFDRELHVNVFWHSNTYLMIKRANRWLPQIAEVLKAKGVPEDFKYLAVIESGLQNAVSPAGATGFWQFMKGTGKECGLEIRREVDERYDPIKSTVAACKYLKQAHKKFGNWTAVAASYNRGMRGLQNAFDAQKVNSYYDLKMNNETSRYVFRILAMKEVLQNPAQYHFEIDEKNLYKKEEVKSVSVTEEVEDLAAYAKKLGINYKILKRHNPWLRKNTLTFSRKGKQSYAIKVPVTNK